MASQTLLFAITIVIAQMDLLLCKAVHEEPGTCNSRYEFESRLLKDVLKVDYEMSFLRKSYNEDIANIQKATQVMDDKFETMIRDLGAVTMQRVEDEIEERITEKSRLLQETMEQLNTALEVKIDGQLAQLRADAIKPPVMFMVRTLDDLTTGVNKVLKFTHNVWNTQADYNNAGVSTHVYDVNSGYFTAPTGGPYLFSLQVCLKQNFHLNVQIRVDGVAISNAILYDTAGSSPCSTVSAVAILSKGSRVCAGLGREYASGTAMYQEEANRWPVFMGARIN